MIQDVYLQNHHNIYNEYLLEYSFVHYNQNLEHMEDDKQNNIRCYLKLYKHY